MIVRLIDNEKQEEVGRFRITEEEWGDIPVDKRIEETLKRLHVKLPPSDYTIRYLHV